MVRFKRERPEFKSKEGSRFGARSDRPRARFGGRGEDRAEPRFERGSSYGGRDGGARRGGFDRERRGPLELHKAICDKCGIECEVPFKPTSSKPIYCRDCFNKQDGNEAPARRSRDSSERPRESREARAPSASMEQIAEINKKLDKIMEALDLK